MKKIPLTQGLFALVDDEDFDRLNCHKWYAAKSRNTFYAQRRVCAHKIVSMHREIMLSQQDEIVDHKNGNGLDNQKENLRIVLQAQNAINRKVNKNNTSGHKGIEFDKTTGKWRPSIRVKNKLIHLGSFSDLDEAIRKRREAEEKHFGEFSRP